MNAEPNIFISFAAGILSFLSPCILPLIPSYISFIGGASIGELSTGSGARGKALIRTGFFIAGFTLVFTVLGVIFTGSGLLFSPASRVIPLISGVIVMLLGAHVLFDFIRILNIEQRFSLSRAPSGAAGAFIAGMAFGGGWTPCVGPIFAGILFLAGQSGRMLVGITYLVAYSAGLGLPFLLTGLFFDRFMNVFSRLKRSLRVFRIAAGLILIGMGLLMVLGRLQTFNAAVMSFGYAFGVWSANHPVVIRWTAGSLFLAAGLLVLLPFRKTPGSPGSSRTAGAAGTADIRRRAGVRLTISVILIAVGLLQFAGLIDLSELITEWLTFQGL